MTGFFIRADGGNRLRSMWMRRYISWFWTGLFLIGSVSAAEPPPYMLKQVENRPSRSLFETADVDGDNSLEAIELMSDQYHFFVRRFSREAVMGPALYQANSIYPICRIAPIEIDPTPGMELAISYRDRTGDSAWVTVVAGADKDRILCRTKAVRGVDISDRGGPQSRGWDGGISRCYAADLNRDGINEIILSVGVGFDLYPRGLYVYEYPSGRLLWQFITAANPGEILFDDVDGDGHLELFFKTYATSNGAVVGDQSDSTADIFALDNTGQLLWRTGTGDRFEFSTSNPVVCDCDRDGITEIYYSTLARSGDLDRQVQVLEKHRAVDNQFIEQRLFDATRRFQQIMIGTMGKDSLLGILLDNGPSIIDPATLRTISDGPVPRSHIEYAGRLGLAVPMPLNRYVGNLGTSTPSSGFILKKDDSLYIMDDTWRLLAAYGTSYGRPIGAVTYFRSPVGGDYLGALVEAGTLGEPGSALVILAVVPAEAAAVAAWWKSGRAPWAVVVVAFLLGIPVGIVLRKMLSHKPRRDTGYLVAYEDLLSALTTFGHGQMAGRNLTRLAFLFANLPEDPKKMEEILPNIASALEAYRSFTAGQLEAITAQGRHVPTIQPAIAELTKQTAQLNALLTDSAPEQLTTEDLVLLKTVVPRTIDSLRHRIKQLETQIQPIFGSDLIKVIPGVLISIAGLLRGRRVKISQVTIVGDYLHLAFFPPTELAAVMEELIINACRAMEESTIRRLSFRLEYTVDQVIIDLSDTGVGLRVDDPEILFSRQYSTRGKEGGFGLHHARQRIERFGGKISIRNNADGPGATVRMVFKGIPHD